MKCWFSDRFFHISTFQNFHVPNARFVYAKRSFWSKTLKTSSVFCLFSKGQNGALASTACTFSKTTLSPLRSANIWCRNRFFGTTALSPRRCAHFAFSCHFIDLSFNLFWSSQTWNVDFLIGFSTFPLFRISIFQTLVSSTRNAHFGAKP